MTLTLKSCERADPSDQEILMLADLLEFGLPYPDVVLPYAVFSRTDQARLIAGLLRRLVE